MDSPAGDESALLRAVSPVAPPRSKARANSSARCSRLAFSRSSRGRASTKYNPVKRTADASANTSAYWAASWKARDWRRRSSMRTKDVAHAAHRLDALVVGIDLG